MLNSTPETPCLGCRHFERRGGIFLPPEMQCTRLEGNDTASVLGRVLQVLARDGVCPERSEYEDFPDSYLSEDLIPLPL